MNKKIEKIKKMIDLSSFYSYRKNREVKSSRLRKRMEKRAGGYGEFDLENYDIHDGNDVTLEEYDDEYRETFITRVDGIMNVLNMELWENERYAREIFGKSYEKKRSVIDGIEVVVYYDIDDNEGKSLKEIIYGDEDIIIGHPSINQGVGFDFMEAMNIASTVTARMG